MDDFPEQWRAVSGFGGDYEVSSIGRVRSFKRKRVKIMAIPIQRGGRGRSPYRKLELYKSGQKHDRTVHQLVCAAFQGEPADGQMVRHLDGDSLNNCASNLTWGSNSENQLDSIAHGTSWHAGKTHCPRGHEYTEGNTYHHGRGRYCRACHRLSDGRRAGRAA